MILLTLRGSNRLYQTLSYSFDVHHIKNYRIYFILKTISKVVLWVLKDDVTALNITLFIRQIDVICMWFGPLKALFCNARQHLVLMSTVSDAAGLCLNKPNSCRLCDLCVRAKMWSLWVAVAHPTPPFVLVHIWCMHVHGTFASSWGWHHWKQVVEVISSH